MSTGDMELWRQEIKTTPRDLLCDLKITYVIHERKLPMVPLDYISGSTHTGIGLFSSVLHI